jgi:hypothetical protein
VTGDERHGVAVKRGQRFGEMRVHMLLCLRPRLRIALGTVNRANTGEHIVKVCRRYSSLLLHQLMIRIIHERTLGEGHPRSHHV